MTEPLAYGLGGDRAYARYYRHSGKAPLPGLIAGVATGVVLAFALGWTYAYVDIHFRFFVVNPFIPAVVGAAVGLATAIAMRLGNVRNGPLSVTMALLAAAATLYVAWAAWIQLLLSRFDFGFFELLIRPLAIKDIARLINSTGTWSLPGPIGAEHPKVVGVPLTVVWIIEALAVLLPAAYFGKKVGIDDPFCDRCRRWMPERAIVATIAPGDPAAIRLAMENREWQVLADAVAKGPPPWDHGWSVQIGHCPRCEELCLLTIRETRATVTRQGQLKQKTRSLVHRLHIDAADAAAICEAVAPPIASAAGEDAAADAPTGDLTPTPTADA